MSQRTTPSITAARRRIGNGLDRISRGVSRRFAIDLRALAALRIALGVLLLADLALRSRQLVDFYTNDGVLPVDVFHATYPSNFSLHALSGEAWVQALLFLVAGTFALALLLGYRTRIATIASWVLLLSLHARNPMIVNSGDTLLRMLLFWSIFLPLGERWSIDARRIDRDRTTVTSVATMAILLQVVLMYVTNAIHKVRGDLWMEGEAVYHIFQADQYTILLGNHLAEYATLLRAVTYAWMALIILSPLLILLMGYWRAALATLFVGMHLGMFVTFWIDLFPVFVMASFVIFYPTAVWDRAASLATRVGVATPLRRGLERLQRTVPTLSMPPLSEAIRSPVPSASSVRALAARSRTAVGTAIPWFFLVLIVLSNAQAVDYTEVPDAGEEVLDATSADQSWQMFAPDPITDTRWIVVPGQLADGTEVDVRTGEDVDWDRPPSVEATYDTSRERKYVSTMRYTDNEKHRSYYANYLCDRWNADHDGGEELESLTLYGMTDQAGPDDDEPDIAEFELLEYDCSGNLVQNE